jgi:hypothetical protein
LELTSDQKSELNITNDYRIDHCSGDQFNNIVSLEGELFVGWDGNGIKQEGMLPLSDEKMFLVSVSAGKELGGIFAESTSDSSGHWEMDHIPPGDYLLYSQVRDEPRHPQFRYMCQSNRDFSAVNGAVPVGGLDIHSLLGYSLSLNESQTMNFEFSHGFLTLPFPKGTPINTSATVDETAGTQYHCGDWHAEYCGMPGERGINFEMSIGTPIVAAAPGKVVSITGLRDGIGYGLTISHDEFTRFQPLSTYYDCMNEVEVSAGQEVYRGQKIGLSGFYYTPHLHFELFHSVGGEALDPYASLWNPNFALGYWTKINDPQFSV